MSNILHSQRRRVFAWLAAWIISTAGIFGFTSRTDADSFIDELYWIGSSYYFDLAFVNHDFSSPDWMLLPARENPPVAKYVIGLGLALADEYVATPEMLASFYATMEQRVPGASGKGADFVKRAAVIAKLKPADLEKIRSGEQIVLNLDWLIPARRAMIVCATVSSLLFLLWGSTTVGWGTGLLASQLLLLHDGVEFAYNHAMADAVAMMFSIAAAFAGWRLLSLDVDAQRRSWCGRVIVCGILLGLACGAKMNSLIVFLLIAVAVFDRVVRFWIASNRIMAMRTLLAGCSVFLVAFVAFVVTNPLLLNDFYGGLISCFNEPRLTAVIQANYATDSVTTFREKSMAVANLAFGGQLKFTLVACFALCCCFTARASVRYIAYWWFVATGCVVLWIPFAWQRYVLPVVFPSVFLVAIAGIGMVSLVIRLALSARSRSNSQKQVA